MSPDLMLIVVHLCKALREKSYPMNGRLPSSVESARLENQATPSPTMNGYWEPKSMFNLVVKLHQERQGRSMEEMFEGVFENGYSDLIVQGREIVITTTIGDERVAMEKLRAVVALLGEEDGA